MTTIEYLSQIERLDRMIQNKLSEIYQFRTMATSITTIPKEVNVESSPEQDKLGTVVAKIVDLENEADMLVDEYIDKRKHIIEQLEGMEDTNMYHILASIYISRKNLIEVSKDFHYSDKQMKRLHHKALRVFEEKYGHEYLKRCPKMSPNVP